MCGWHGSDGTVRGEGSDGDSRGWTAARVLVPCQEGTEAPTGRAAIESMSGPVPVPLPPVPAAAIRHH